MSSSSYNGSTSTNSSIRESSTPDPTSRKIPSGSGRRLRSSTRLRTINDTINENSISSQSVKSSRLSGTNVKDCASTSNNSILASTRNIQDKVAMFMDTIRIAMKTLMEEHGYSRERAKISLLDQLVSFTSTTTPRQDTIRMDTNLTTSHDVEDVSNSSVSSSNAPSLAISDEKVNRHGCQLLYYSLSARDSFILTISLLFYFGTLFSRFSIICGRRRSVWNMQPLP